MTKDIEKNLEEACYEAGLDLVWKSIHHCQILGGTKHSLVNCWPDSKKGFRMQIPDQKSIPGTIDTAILLAGPVDKFGPPFKYEAVHKSFQDGLPVAFVDKEVNSYKDDCKRLRESLLAILGLTSLHWDGGHCIRDRIRDIAIRAIENM